MPTIIVSYRREDSRHITGRIVDRLEQHYGKGQVFMDIDAIPYGTDFRQHLRNMLDRCDLLVAVVGPHWIGADASGQPRISDPTDWVRIEIETALSKDIPVIPVLIDRAHMPNPRELPESLRDFAYRQGADLDTGRDFHPHMDRLIRAISESVVRREAETRHHTDEDESRRQHQAAEQKRKEDEERLRQEAEAKRREEVRRQERAAEQKRKEVDERLRREAEAKRRDEKELRRQEENAEQNRKQAEERQLSDPVKPRDRRLYLALLVALVVALGIGISVMEMLPSVTADFNTCHDSSGDAAIAACSRAIASGQLTGKDLALAFTNRGFEYNAEKDYDRAIGDYDQAIKFDPQLAIAFHNRGLAYYAKQAYDRAIADYDQAFKLDPTYAVALYDRGLAKQKKGDPAGGASDIAAARAINPNVGK
jgi:tetratricopeptide (TPR) repeat protein